MENVTRRDVIAACEECERNATFDVHVDPVDPETVLPVDENFEFIPKTKKELLSIKGFGEAKYQKYGEEILKITADYSSTV